MTKKPNDVKKPSDNVVAMVLLGAAVKAAFYREFVATEPDESKGAEIMERINKTYDEGVKDLPRFLNEVLGERKAARIVEQFTPGSSAG